jgi:hypothetical protein
MNKRHLLIIFAVVVIVALAAYSLILKPFLIDSGIEQEYTILSPVYHVDKIYKSMKGPSSVNNITFPGVAEDELIWITGFKAVMVGEDGNTPVSQEFMCHSNLDIDIKKHKKIVGWDKTRTSSRLFTLSQGQYEIDFPEGFGIPLIGKEKLKLVTQVLNLNDRENEHYVRHKITVKYVRESDATEPLKPLVQTGAVGVKLLKGEDGYFGIKETDENLHGSSCLPGETATRHSYKDRFGRVFTGHWVVEPGREENHTNVTKFINIPYDTTIHYIAVHLHPFAESLKFVDLTTGKTLFHSKVRAPEDRIGINHVEYFESTEGLPVYKDHQYQLISVYNNTSEEPQDSMAVMYLYILDKEFNRDLVVSRYNNKS